MQRLGKSQIPLSFKTPGTGEYDGQPPHKEARPMCAPNVRVDFTRSTKIEKVVLILPTECVWQVLAAFQGRRHGNKLVARRLSQRPKCSQIARRIAFQS